MGNERPTPVWFRAKKANAALSKWRQVIYERFILANRYRPRRLSERIKCLFPWYRELQVLRRENSKVHILLAEKRDKLANADAQVAELSQARDGLFRLARERRDEISELKKRLNIK